MKTKILFVCLGNICRSPLAEGVLKQKVSEAGQERAFDIDSCGTSNYHIGNLPDPRTRQNALRNGVKLEHHARQLIPDDLANYDYILVMDQSNMEDTLLLDPKETYRHKIFLLREFDSQNDNLNVPDPYFGGEDGFQQVFEIIDRSADGFLHFLNKPGT